MIALENCAYFAPDGRIIRKQGLHFPILMILIVVFCLLERLDLVRGERVEEFLAGKDELDSVITTERSSMMWRVI